MLNYRACKYLLIILLAGCSHTEINLDQEIMDLQNKIITTQHETILALNGELLRCINGVEIDDYATCIKCVRTSSRYQVDTPLGKILDLIENGWTYDSGWICPSCEN